MKIIKTALVLLLALILLAGCGGLSGSGGSTEKESAETAGTSESVKAEERKTVRHVDISMAITDSFSAPGAVTLQEFLCGTDISCSSGAGEGFVAEPAWNAGQYLTQEMAALEDGMTAMTVTPLSMEDYLFSNRVFSLRALIAPAEGWAFPADVTEIEFSSWNEAPEPQEVKLTPDGCLSFLLEFTEDYSPADVSEVELNIDYPRPGQYASETFVGVLAQTAHAHYGEEELEILSAVWEDQSGTPVLKGFDDTARSLTVRVKLPASDRFADGEIVCRVTDHFYEFTAADGSTVTYAVEEHLPVSAGVTKESERVAVISAEFETQHSLSFYEGYSSGCISYGEKDCYLCATCGRIFADAEGLTEMTEEELKTGPLGHEYVPSSHCSEADCCCGGRTYEECSRCGKLRLIGETEPLGHDYVKSEKDSVAPGCTENGYDVYYCSRCGRPEVKVLLSEGHQFVYTIIDGNRHLVSCGVCGRDLYTEAHEHPWEECGLCGYCQIN